MLIQVLALCQCTGYTLNWERAAELYATSNCAILNWLD